MSEVDRQLSQAYELIEAGNYSEAREILEPLLVTEPDNADVWWMYSHAVEDREKAREALENVLRIDPNYEGAEDLLGETRGSPPINIDDHQDDDALIDEFLDSDDFDDDLDYLDEDFAPKTQTDSEESGGRRTALLGFLMLAIIVIVVVLGFLLLNSGGNGDDDNDSQTIAEASPEVTETVTTDGVDSTSIPTIGAGESIIQPEETEEDTASSPTEAETPDDDTATSEPTQATNGSDDEEETPDTQTQVTDATETLEDDDTATSESPEATADSDDEETPDAQAQVTDDDEYGFLYAALSNLSVVDDSAEVTGTDFGDTLLVSVCTTPGSQLRSDLREAMTAIASQSDSLSDVDAAGIRLVDCDEDRILNVIAVSIEDATALQSGELEQDAFSSRWRPVG